MYVNQLIIVNIVLSSRYAEHTSTHARTHSRNLILLRTVLFASYVVWLRCHGQGSGVWKVIVRCKTRDSHDL